MAREVHVFPVTVPAGTLATAPQVTQLLMPPRVVDEVEIQFPPGPRGEVGVALGSSGVAVIPSEAGQYIISDDEIVHWPLEGQWNSGSWECHAINTGLYSHTITFRFLVRLTTDAAPSGELPLDPSQLGAVPSSGPPAGGTIPPLPPLPPITLPPLPPITVPPLPPLPPLPGTGNAAPTPKYTYWSDAMGKLLTWPDQTNSTRFDEVGIQQDGSVYWYAFGGGAGSWDSYQQPAGSLGGNFVEVSACFTLYQGVVRLNIVATDKAGRRYLKVMNATDYTPIQDWVAEPGGQTTEEPLSQRAAG